MMWKIHKKDEINSDRRITSDAMLPKVWKDLTVTEAWKVCVYFFPISSYFTEPDHNKLYYYMAS